MCGASLAHPPIQTKPPLRDASPELKKSGGDGVAKADPPETVHGPSFLGLAEDPKVEFHYLYEDEQPSSHIGLIFVLILLLAAGGFGYWQWRHNGFPFNRFGNQNAAAQSASPSEAAPASAQDQQPPLDKPMTGAGEVQPSASNDNKPPDSGKATDFPVQGGPAAAAPSTNPAPNNTGNAQATPPAADSEPTAQQPQEEAKASAPASVPERTPVKAARRTPPPKPAAKPAPKAAQVPPAVKGVPDADLEASGERYLYGTDGTPQDCARAGSALRTAAAHGNPKAQAVLGTMYYTGHCVARDLPTAYRWFARALRQQPQNSTLSADLQVLWRQMTPEEKKLAMNTE